MKARFINILRYQGIRLKWKHDMEDRTKDKQKIWIQEETR